MVIRFLMKEVHFSMIDLYLIRKLMLGASSYHFMLVGMVEVVVVTVRVVEEEVAATAQGSLADATVAIMISFIITIISVAIMVVKLDLVYPCHHINFFIVLIAYFIDHQILTYLLVAFYLSFHKTSYLVMG